MPSVTVAKWNSHIVECSGAWRWKGRGKRKGLRAHQLRQPCRNRFAENLLTHVRAELRCEPNASAGRLLKRITCHQPIEIGIEIIATL